MSFQENLNKILSKHQELSNKLASGIKGEEFINGSIYDSRDGKTYTGKIWIENNTLRLRGYWGMFYATESWERVKSNL
jgi:uncharacterized protein (DUF2147 family)